MLNYKGESQKMKMTAFSGKKIVFSLQMKINLFHKKLSFDVSKCIWALMTN